MFFPASKIVYFVIQPSSLIALALLCGLLLTAFTARRRLGLVLSFAGLLMLAVAGLSPLGNLLVIPLEERFPPFRAERVPSDVAGIIILGGFEDTRPTDSRPGLGLNESAERLTEAARLAHAEPRLKVVFTGGVGSLFAGVDSAANSVAAFLDEIGIDPGRIILESRSRNTYENARLTIPLLASKPGERWLLVTSAYHMPRSMGIFRQAGLDVIAHPVDFRTSGPGDATAWFASISDGLRRVDMAVKEWIGLVAYRMAGYTNALFPAP